MLNFKFKNRAKPYKPRYTADFGLHRSTTVKSGRLYKYILLKHLRKIGILQQPWYNCDPLQKFKRFQKIQQYLGVFDFGPRDFKLFKQTQN